MALADRTFRPGITLALTSIVRAHGFFSLGGFLSRFWRPAYLLLPWAFTSAMLTVIALWDRWTRGGAIDYTVLGLAAYELMIGLMEEDAPAPAIESAREGEAWTSSHSPRHMPTVEH